MHYYHYHCFSVRLDKAQFSHLVLFVPLTLSLSLFSISRLYIECNMNRDISHNFITFLSLHLVYIPRFEHSTNSDLLP